MRIDPVVGPKKLQRRIIRLPLLCRLHHPVSIRCPVGAVMCATGCGAPTSMRPEDDGRPAQGVTANDVVWRRRQTTSLRIPYRGDEGGVRRGATD